MKKSAALLALVLAALALAACGSSSSDSTSAPETTAESTGANAGGAGAGEGSGGGSVVEIEAVDGAGLEYTSDQATTKAGQVSIDFNNPQGLSHDVAIESADGEMIGKTDLVADGSTTATIGDLEPGEYTFYCTVPGHREAGMEGTLTVE
jgi:uncharacterized cupredoxin-like copper-binding protein